MTRLADISLQDPVSISVLDESRERSQPEDRAIQEVAPLQSGPELDGFAIPESLDQHVTLVPSKLRLVCLAAFLLQKCKVRPGIRRARRGRRARLSGGNAREGVL